MFLINGAIAYTSGPCPEGLLLPDHTFRLCSGAEEAFIEGNGFSSSFPEVCQRA